MNQRELISKLKQGDGSAFEQAIAQWQDLVYNTALGLVQESTEAEDITQEVFIQLYQSVSGFREEALLSTWLYRVTVNKSLDSIRRNRTKKRLGLIGKLIGIEAYEEPDTFYHPGVQLEQKENAARLLDAIRRLPDLQRVAFTLQKMEGLSQQEIADVMEKSIDSVESLLKRARQQLKKILIDTND